MASYERSTQLPPALAVLAPLSILVVLTFRVGDFDEAVRSAVGIAAAAGGHLVVMRLVRDRGNRLQKRLWDSWGGSPTVQLMRWRGRHDRQVDKLHRRVQAMTGVALPTRDEEETSALAADESYEDAIRHLRELTRDHERYPRVYSELVQYGTARNLLALKTIGLFVAGGVALTGGIGTFASINNFWDVAWWWPTASSVAALVSTLTWSLVITQKYVRTAADRYANALLSVPLEPGGGTV